MCISLRRKHQPISLSKKKKKKRQNTLLTLVIISVGQGLAGLDVLAGLLGGIRVGCLIVIIWVLVLALVAHD
jgi:hypothetical protein